MQKPQIIEMIGRDKAFFPNLSGFWCWCENVYFGQKENHFLWLPVFFGTGIAVYFSLPFEPPVIVSLFVWVCGLTFGLLM